jgi:hypothetical protein
MKKQFFLIALLISANIVAMNNQLPPQTPKTPKPRHQQIQELAASIPTSLRDNTSSGVGLGLTSEHKAVDFKDDNKATPPPNQSACNAVATHNPLTSGSSAPAPQLGLKFRNVGAGLGVGHSFDAHIKEVPNIPLTISTNTGLRTVGVVGAGGSILNALPKGCPGCLDCLVLASSLATIVAPEKTKKAVENTGAYLSSRAMHIYNQLPSRADINAHVINRRQQCSQRFSQCFGGCCNRLNRIQTACCKPTKLCGCCSNKKKQ